VNSTYSLFGIHVTQAQLIAAACVAAGLAIMWRRRNAIPGQPIPVSGPP
jgi:hypothetical protein